MPFVIFRRGSFAVQFGDHFRSGDHLRSGIICGAVQALFFLSKLSLVSFLPIMARAIWKLEHISPSGQQHKLPGMPCLVWTLFATKRWLFPAKMYRIHGKKIYTHLSRYEENKAYKYYPIFFGIMRSELNYAVSHRCIIPEALKIT